MSSSVVMSLSRERTGDWRVVFERKHSYRMYLNERYANLQGFCT